MREINAELFLRESDNRLIPDSFCLFWRFAVRASSGCDLGTKKFKTENVS